MGNSSGEHGSHVGVTSLCVTAEVSFDVQAHKSKHKTNTSKLFRLIFTHQHDQYFPTIFIIIAHFMAFYLNRNLHFTQT
jgi:hypothetical protein